MNPHRRDKVDITGLDPKLLLSNKYGRLATPKSAWSMTPKDRKYFDSGDYALSKAGKTPRDSVGTAIPSPENIPHASPVPVPNYSIPNISVQISPVNSPTSPAKESSLSHESTLADIMSSDPTTSDTTVETESTVVEEVVELTSPVIVSNEDAQEIESKTAGSGSGDSDIKMD
jgi:hypothetical protein